MRPPGIRKTVSVLEAATKAAPDLRWPHIASGATWGQPGEQSPPILKA